MALLDAHIAEWSMSVTFPSWSVVGVLPYCPCRGLAELAYLTAGLVPSGEQNFELRLDARTRLVNPIGKY